MRYIMLMYSDPAGEEYVPEDDNVKERLVAEMDRRKVRTFGSRLQGPDTAATVRRRKGTE